MDTIQFNENCNNEIETLYREKELAEILRISLPTLKRLRYNGKIGFLRIGMQVRYARHHLEEYLQTCHRSIN